MGDMADLFEEERENEFIAHLNGECESFCPYCQEEEESRQERIRRSKRRSRNRK